MKKYIIYQHFVAKDFMEIDLAVGFLYERDKPRAIETYLLKYKPSHRDFIRGYLTAEVKTGFITNEEMQEIQENKKTLGSWYSNGLLSISVKQG